jgi:hypothetical protein
MPLILLHRPQSFPPPNLPQYETSGHQNCLCLSNSFITLLEDDDILSLSLNDDDNEHYIYNAGISPSLHDREQYPYNFNANARSQSAGKDGHHPTRSSCRNRVYEERSVIRNFYSTSKISNQGIWTLDINEVSDRGRRGGRSRSFLKVQGKSWKAPGEKLWTLDE